MRKKQIREMSLLEAREAIKRAAKNAAIRMRGKWEFTKPKAS
jgi:hypothetical protein